MSFTINYGRCSSQEPISGMHCGQTLGHSGDCICGCGCGMFWTTNPPTIPSPPPEMETPREVLDAVVRAAESSPAMTRMSTCYFCGERATILMQCRGEMFACTPCTNRFCKEKVRT
jgi:hypothetical protein